MHAKVLLVDDEAPFIETLAKRLAKRDLTIVTAFSGAEALQKLDSEANIDIVVLDVKMPGMDGIETLKAIKNIHPMVEVIMLTGHATVESAIEGMKLGALDYLMKPCDIEVLMVKAQEAKSKKNKQEEKIAEARALQIALRRGD
jgi:two-component system, OmpR family, response regulator VicR